MVIWKDVEGFEGLYKVSNDGVLISTHRHGAKGRVIKPQKTKGGAEEYSLSENGKVCRIYAHRLLAKCFIPNPENKPQVSHIDGNPTNNSLDNLEWVTPKENIQNVIKDGRFNNKGEKHTNSKLTDNEVLEIRDLYKHKIYKQRELGEMYGVSQRQVSVIVRNKARRVVEN